MQANNIDHELLSSMHVINLDLKNKTISKINMKDYCIGHAKRNSNSLQYHHYLINAMKVLICCSVITNCNHHNVYRSISNKTINVANNHYFSCCYLLLSILNYYFLQYLLLVYLKYLCLVCCLLFLIVKGIMLFVVHLENVVVLLSLSSN